MFSSSSPSLPSPSLFFSFFFSFSLRLLLFEYVYTQLFQYCLLKLYPFFTEFPLLLGQWWVDCICISLYQTSLVAQRLKRLPAMWETQVRSLGWEDPLEKEMVTNSSILAWRIPWTEEPGRLQSTGSQRVGHDWATSLSLSMSDLFLVFHCSMSYSSLTNAILSWLQ